MLEVVVPVEPVLQGQVGEDVVGLGEEDLPDGGVGRGRGRLVAGAGGGGRQEARGEGGGGVGGGAAARGGRRRPQQVERHPGWLGTLFFLFLELLLSLYLGFFLLFFFSPGLTLTLSQSLL